MPRSRSGQRAYALRGPAACPETPRQLFRSDAFPVSALCRARPTLRPLGQIHDSFIIAAGRDGLWIIDQHVAHERILFEKVLKQRAAGNVEVQRLLMPLIVQLNSRAAD